MYRNNIFKYDIGDLIKIYSPLSQHHGYYGLIIDGPNDMHLYTILFQEDMVKKTFAFNELERIN